MFMQGFYALLNLQTISLFFLGEIYGGTINLQL